MVRKAHCLISWDWQVMKHVLHSQTCSSLITFVFATKMVKILIFRLQKGTSEIGGRFHDPVALKQCTSALGWSSRTRLWRPVQSVAAIKVIITSCCKLAHLQCIITDSRWNSWYSSSPWREQTFPPTTAAQFLHNYSPSIRSLQLGVILGLMHIQFANPIFTSNDLRPAQLSLYCQCCGTTGSLCICASY